MLEFINRKSNTPSSLQYEEELLLDDDDNTSDVQQDEPVDEGHLVYWVFFLYGLAMLLPWNVFITASEYFAARFTGSAYQETFQSYFSTYFTVTNMIVFVHVLWKQSAPNANPVNVLTPIVFNAVIFGLMAISVGTDFDGSTYFWMTLTLMALTGATTSFFQVAVFAQASRFPPRYVQAVMSGQGMAGVTVAASSILSSFTGTTTRIEKDDNDEGRKAAMIYFISALVVTVAALLGRILLNQQPFYNYHITLQKTTTDSSTETRRVRTLVQKSSGLVFSVAFVFIVTLMVFPSITSLVKSVNSGSRFFDDDIFVAMHFLLFNLGDWLGRLMPLWWRTFNPTRLCLLSCLRVLFIPLFLVCHVVAAHRHLPTLISSDTLYFLLVTVFSMTSGWICSLAMMAAPQQPFLRTPAEKSLIGSVMSFALVVGLAIGGCLSFWARSMV